MKGPRERTREESLQSVADEEQLQIRLIMAGSYLKDVREAMSLSQNELARRSGVSVSVISRIESGKTGSLHERNIVALADALGIPAQVVRDLIKRPRVEAPTLRVAVPSGPSRQEDTKTTMIADDMIPSLVSLKEISTSDRDPRVRKQAASLLSHQLSISSEVGCGSK